MDNPDLYAIAEKLNANQPLTKEEQNIVKGSDSITIGRIRAELKDKAPKGNLETARAQGVPAQSPPISSFAPLPKAPGKVSFPDAPAPAPVAPAPSPVPFQKPTGMGLDAVPKPAPMAEVPPPPVAPVADTKKDIPVSKKLDAVQQYLKDKPNGNALMNVLDVLAASLKGYAGQEYKTQAQLRNEMERQNVMATAQADRERENQMQTMGLGQQFALQTQAKQLENELVRMQQEYENNLAILGPQQRIYIENMLAQKKAELDNAMKLIDPQANAQIRVAKETFGLPAAQQTPPPGAYANQFVVKQTEGR